MDEPWHTVCEQKCVLVTEQVLQISATWWFHQWETNPCIEKQVHFMTLYDQGREEENGHGRLNVGYESLNFARLPPLLKYF